jgi:peptide/nickel transport system permease protein
MLFYLGRRILAMIPTILIPMLLLFVLIRLAPGGPAAALLGDEATPEQISAMNSQLGLDKPLAVQFVEFLGNLVQLDFGESLFLRQNVTTLVLDRLSVTASLVLLALILALLMGVVFGTLAARFHGRPADNVLVGLATVGIAIPSFWLAVLLVGLFAVKLRWLPVAGYAPLSQPGEFITHLVLPVTCLALLQAADIFRYSRAATLDSMNQPFVTTARSLGVSEGKIFGNDVFRMTLVPVLTVFGLNLAQLLGGAVVLETIFGLPGLGQLLLTAVERRDYALIQGCAFFIAIILVVANLVIDLLYGAIDPRIRYEKAAS